MSFGALNYAPIFTTASGLAYRADIVSSTLHYYGFAKPGTTEATAAWQIQKVTLDANGNITKIEWPKLTGSTASANFAYIWNDGAGFTHDDYTFA